MWYIYTMEYYAATKRKSSCSLQDMGEAGNHILSKLTQEKETKHRMFSLINES